jgi:PAS domain S-box-containing protein
MPDFPARQPLSLRAWLLLTMAAAAVVFALDVLTAPGVDAAVLYAVVILISLRAPNPRAPLAAAAVCSILAWTDALLSHRATGSWLVNVALVMAVIWTAAVLVSRYMVVARAWADRSLKELEDLKYAIDQSAIVAVTDTRGIIRSANDKFCEISKYSRAELIGKDHRLVNSGFHPKSFIRNLWQTIGSGRIWKGELRNRAKDGTVYWVDTTIVPFLDHAGRPYQYMALRYDITERKRTEELMREQAALARLGEMAAIVAHEVKNPLAGIRGALQVIGARMPADSRDRPVLADILARLDSLNEMVQDLLLFARPRPPRWSKVAPGPLVEATAVLLRRDPLFHHVAVTVDPTPGEIDADPELLQLVFSNLLVNAAQAMDGRGEVFVSAARRDDGTYTLAFRDTGPGIPPDVRQRVFEPFYTTKHRGTGLGLATARRVIEQHHGTMTLDCPPGGGTIVMVQVPAAQPAAAQDASDRPTSAPEP